MNVDDHPYRAFRAFRAGAANTLPAVEPLAYHGLAGRWAEAVGPYTEASPIGVLAATLVAFGNAAGRSAHIEVGPTPHYANEFVVLVGPTATGRKGEAIRMGLRPLILADEAWGQRVKRGFGSGESMVEEVRDPEPGAGDEHDPRLLVFEDEFASPLTIAARKGSTMSALLRSAWDGSRLENRTKGNRIVASNAHVSFLAGITPDELIRLVAASEVANGFLNRFLVVGVQRPWLLPNPPPINGQVQDEYVAAFQQALRFARTRSRIHRTRDADARWAEAYSTELSVDRWGLAGAACSRAEAHTLRLSLIYALLDQSSSVEEVHVEAALAFWRYAESTTRLLFGERLGDPVADGLIEGFQAASDAGLTRTQIGELFSRHVLAEEIDQRLGLLRELGFIEGPESILTGGRPVTFYRLKPRAKSAESAISPSPPTKEVENECPECGRPWTKSPAICACGYVPGTNERRDA